MSDHECGEIFAPNIGFPQCSEPAGARHLQIRWARSTLAHSAAKTSPRPPWQTISSYHRDSDALGHAFNCKRCQCANRLAMPYVKFSFGLSCGVLARLRWSCVAATGALRRPGVPNGQDSPAASCHCQGQLIRFVDGQSRLTPDCDAVICDENCRLCHGLSRKLLLLHESFLIFRQRLDCNVDRLQDGGKLLNCACSSFISEISSRYSP